MQLKKLVFLSVTLAILFPATAYAGDIDVEAGNVRIRSEQGGRVSIDTGSNSVNVNSRTNRSVPWWQRWNYFNRSRSSRYCSNSTYQSSTQTTSVNGRVQRTSVSRSTCR
ncbi:MAG: hypothetical protein QNJ70_13535 [Xenococcaceae cyanobacterium MO_207.B15]|nr:hypothetical protein [Xenococcaceae cyanobacterium MO_207.B15]MDJ0746722.1 hypothetical protein [Xenococcaceae cyanobacterium MO_167.B27]